VNHTEEGMVGTLSHRGVVAVGYQRHCSQCLVRPFTRSHYMVSRSAPSFMTPGRPLAGDAFPVRGR